MLGVIILCRYAECRYSECRYAECRYAECRYAECRYAEYRFLCSKEAKNRLGIVFRTLHFLHYL
jgi:hypothetical protein